MTFRYVLQDQWPTLSWLARGNKSDRRVTVYHGNGVEVAPEWFCEAAWAGEFDRGDFDQTDIVAGSGARIREGSITFVSPGSTVDRIQWSEDADSIYVSNSICCLMSFTGAEVDPTYGKYVRDANTVVNGLDRYKPSVQSSLGEIQLVYSNNLVWDERGCRSEPKPGLGRDFSTFEKYHAFMQQSMAALIANIGAASRRYSLQPMGTLSSGYDSTMIAVLAQQNGLQEVITFHQARGGEDDSGASAAKILGLRVHSIDREAWRNEQFPEVPFIASYSSAEDMIFLGADQHLRGKVLLTGYHGGKVWDKLTTYLSDKIVRGDPSGLALTEYRLHAGFINCAVPFWETRQIRDIHAISNSDVMKPWDIPGNYSRPICRRIAEEAGLPRERFGMAKKAVTVDPFGGWDVLHEGGNFLTPSSRKGFLAWIRLNRGEWLKRGKIPPIASVKVNFLVNSIFMLSIDLNRWVAANTPLWRILGHPAYHPHYLNLYLFAWAVDRIKRRYLR